MPEAEKEKPGLTRKQKIGLGLQVGANLADTVMKSRLAKKDKKLEALSAARKSIVGATDGSAIDRVEMGLPPILADLNVPMRSATSLLSESTDFALKGTDSRDLKSKMREGILSRMPASESGRAQQTLEHRKRRIVHGSLSRRNPELYQTRGPAGLDSQKSSLLKQIER